MNRRIIFSALLLVTCSTILRADIKLPSIFSDRMVLQRGVCAPVWGWADPGEKISVTAADQTQTTTADTNGKWHVTLNPIQNAGPIAMSVAGKNHIDLHDVLVGEVWLGSGQSNMGFTLKQASNGPDAIAHANRSTLRLFVVGRAIKDTPQDQGAGQWVICSPDTVPDFSAVAYFFGRNLQDNLNTPVGLIEAEWGGTRAEAWLPKPTFDALKLPYEPAWTEEWLHPKPNPASTQPAKVRPYETPAGLYNGMIAPIAGYPMRGIIWYQGETNTAHAEQYQQVLTALIQSWRDAWSQPDLPFLIVQLPNFQNTRFWPILREAQRRVAADIPHVGMVVTIDVGNPHNIHPNQKEVVGQRLALMAEKMVYGQNVEDSGPTFKTLTINGDKAVITFDHLAGGLVAKGGVVQGFELAGDDGKFVKAHATIDSQTVIVSADNIKAPKIVRYGWENDPTCTLYNQAGLPAGPFEAR